MNLHTRSASFPRRHVLMAAAVFLFLFFTIKRGFSAPAAPTPDVLVFTNGDQLTGKLVQADGGCTTPDPLTGKPVKSAGGCVTFHSDMAGDITVDWAKIKEIRTPQQFAVIEKGVKPSRKTPEALVPHGAVTIADQNVEVHTQSGGTTPPIPVANINFMIDQPTYQSKVNTEPGFFHDWHGAGTF